ncbi:MAG: hypothetical protein NTZ05_11090 [Chloroflexi bacterium]|nr:hypothetical protein [Chloroflexota bacterium]
MIENERQYEVTKKNIANFEGALSRIDQEYAGHSEITKRVARFEYQRELDKLRAELAEYESRPQERRSASA